MRPTLAPAAAIAGALACLALPSGALAAQGAPNLRCNGSYADATYDNVTVPSQATCSLTDVTVLGNATVQRGTTTQNTSLNLNGTGTIHGNVTLDGNSDLTDVSDWTIGGKISANRANTIEIGGGTTHDITSEGSQALYVFSTTVDGSVIADKTVYGGEVSYNNVVTGDVLVSRTSSDAGLFGIDGESIGGSVEVIGNHAEADITSDQIGHNLVCEANTPPPTGGDDQVGGRAEGQCAAFAAPAGDASATSSR